jgi:hypothetical protein
MARDALADRRRLADIQDLPVPVGEHVDARLIRKALALLFD